MKIFRTHPTSTESGKIPLIKTLRGHTGIALRPAVEIIDHLLEHGEVFITGNLDAADMQSFDSALRECGNFSAEPDISEMVVYIEKAIAAAIVVRDYKKARSLINLLPRDLKPGVVDAFKLILPTPAVKLADYL